MTLNHTSSEEPAAILAPSEEYLRRVRRPAGRRGLMFAVPLAIIAVFVAAAIFGPMLLPFHSTATNLAERLLPPGAHLADGTIAWLGTDQVGRPLLPEMLSGARVSMLVAISTVLIGGAIGTLLGIVGGYFRGAVDAVIMRLGDIQLAFPSILLAILLAGVLGASVANVILTLAITRWVIFARVVRASTLVVASSKAVEAAHLIGVPNRRVILRYVLPITVGPLFVTATVQVGLMIIAEASLSFLGLGVPLSVASWGSIIANGRNFISSAWWIATFPGLAITILVACVGLLTMSTKQSRISAL